MFRGSSWFGRRDLVSFAALPAGAISTDGPSFITCRPTRRDRQGCLAVGRGLLAVGGPAYGDRAQPPAAPAARRGVAGARHIFEDLPGSRTEAAQIADLVVERRRAQRRGNADRSNRHRDERQTVGCRPSRRSSRDSRIFPSGAVRHCDRRHQGVGGLIAGSVAGFAENHCCCRSRVCGCESRNERANRQSATMAFCGRGGGRTEPTRHRVGGAFCVRYGHRSDQGRRA